ncbi:MAG TPA: acyl-CoA dehydrogenase [Streptosporangiaceae bacterium]|nr:acyl-CoA dehydrogenase [Streptosporangiaceae bacterium]
MPDGQSAEQAAETAGLAAETAEQAELRATVARIAGKFGGSYYAARAQAHQSCDELWQALAEAGFVGVNIPVEYGGGGGGITELAIVCEQTAAQGCPLLLLLVSSAISGEVLARYGTPEQKSTWLPGIADGTGKVVFAITEPDAGSNTHRLSTTARRDGDEWVLTGTKYYISGVDEAAAILVVARIADAQGADAQEADAQGAGSRRFGLFLLPAGAPGLSASPLSVDAMLPERQFTLHFDDIRLRSDALVGGDEDGLAQVFHGLNPERITAAALCVGVARYALNRAADYARTRTVWDVPIGGHQGVAHPLARAKIETELAALMTSKAAWCHDHGQPAGEAANMAKYAAAEAAIAAVDQAIQTHGGNGLSTEYGLVPLWGIARLLRIAPVNREMVLNYVAQHSLRLPRSY